MVTAKGSMSTEGETLQFSVLPYRWSILPTLVTDTRAMHVCGRNLTAGLTSAASASVDISSTCKVGQKIGVSLPLLTCSPSAWPPRLLYRRGRKSRRDLWITVYRGQLLVQINIQAFCCFGTGNGKNFPALVVYSGWFSVQRTQHSEHGGILKSRNIFLFVWFQASVAVWARPSP